MFLYRALTINACYFLEPTSMNFQDKMAGFVEYQIAQSNRVQDYIGKFFVTFINSCSSLPKRNIGTHCVNVGSALKNNVVLCLM